MEYILKGEELEKAVEKSRDLGEGMAIVNDEGHGFAILNKQTGKVRQFVGKNGALTVPDNEIDYDAIEKGCPHYHRPSKTANYSDTWPWSNFKDGVCAIRWMIYPDGMYFADSDGYGMEDNNEEDAYCIIDKDLNVIVPFQPMVNVRQTLNDIAMRLKDNQEHRPNEV